MEFLILKFDRKRIVVNGEGQYFTSDLTIEPEKLSPGSPVTLEFNLDEARLLRAHLSDDRPTMITFNHEGGTERFVQCAITQVEDTKDRHVRFTCRYETVTKSAESAHSF